MDSALEGVELRSEDVRSFAELIWQWIVAHPLYAKLLVGSLAFFLFSLGVARIIRAAKGGRT